MAEKRSFLTLLLVIAIAILMIAGAFSTSETTQMKSVQAKPELVFDNQTLNLSGLEHSVNVVQDSNGVYHIYAQDNHDLFYALGFVQSENRLFKMETYALEGMGLMSRFFGPLYQPYDEFQAMTGAPLAAQRDWNSVVQNRTTNATDRLTYDALTAYAEGINSYINYTRDIGELPTMFALTNTTPFYWSPVYSFAVQEVMTQSLAFGTNPLVFSLVYSLLGNQTYDLIPTFSPVQTYYYGGYTGAPNQSVLAISHNTYPVNATLKSLIVEVMEEFDPLSIITKNDSLDMSYWLPHGHSNEWVVAGNRTTTGYPILTGGPVLAFSLPSIWFQVQLVDPSFDVYGVVLPGAPSVIIGFNRNIAWTLTDVQDISSQNFFFSQTVSNGKYLWNGTYYPVKEYDINGVEVNWTNLGPIMAINGTTALVMHWLGNEVSNEIGVLLDINMASDWSEFSSDLSMWIAPFQNFAFADRNTIGDISAGQYPIFSSSSGIPYNPAGVMPGNGKEYISGEIPYNMIPHAVNPSAGYIVSSNQRQVGPSYPYWLGNTLTNSPGYRAELEASYLAAHPNVSVQDMMNLQLKNFTDYEAVLAMPYILSDLSHSGYSGVVSSMFSSWNESMSPSSKTTTVWFFFYENLFNDTFIPYLTEKGWIPGYENVLGYPSGLSGSLPNTSGYSPMDMVMLQIIELGSARPFSNLSVTSLMSEAANQTMSYLNSNFPSGNYTWSNFYGFVFPNLWGISQFNVGPLVTGGDFNTPNDAGGIAPDYPQGGQSWVMVANLSNLSDSYGVYPGGQSENPESPLYANYVDDWISGHYLHLIFVSNYTLFPSDEVMDRSLFVPDSVPGDMTAKIVAYSGEVISGSINATGYDFGVYIGPGVTNIYVYHAHVFGANDQGVIALDTHGIFILDSNISHNDVHANPAIPLNTGLGLYGVSDSYVVGNIVTYDAAGGIVVSNAGNIPTGLPFPLMMNMSANYNTIADNYVAYDADGCGIVIVAFNAGSTVSGNWVFNNTVLGSIQLNNGTFTGPYVGTIVVAADTPGTMNTGTVVLDNTVIGGLESSIVVNAQAPTAEVNGVEIIDNVLVHGGFQRVNAPPFSNASDLSLPPAPNAIAIYGNYQPGMPFSPTVVNVFAFGNVMKDQGIGIWVANSYHDVFGDNVYQNVTTQFESYYGVG